MNLPPYSSYPLVQGKSVSLRQIDSVDLPYILEISYYDAIQASDVVEAGQMQEKIYADYLAGNSIHWGIFDNTSNHIVGSCGYYRGFAAGAGELGCVLMPQFYGKGYMTEAMILAIDFAVKTMQLQRIFAITAVDNTKAIQLLERLDFRKVADLDTVIVEYEWAIPGLM